MAGVTGDETVPLCELGAGKTGVVCELLAGGNLRRRLLDLGFVQGSRVTALRNSPFGDPRAYALRGAVYALRSAEARLIRVRMIDNA